MHLGHIRPPFVSVPYLAVFRPCVTSMHQKPAAKQGTSMPPHDVSDEVFDTRVEELDVRRLNQAHAYSCSATG